MDWFHSITLRNRFIGLLVIIVVLSLSIGFMLVRNISSSSQMVGEITANDTRALYAKELQILLLRIDGGFKNLSDVEDGIDDADTNMEIVRQTIAFLRKAQDMNNGTVKVEDMTHMGDDHASTNGNSIHSTVAVDLGAYAKAYEDYYQHARATAQDFAQTPDGDTDDYFGKLDGYKNDISRKTDDLMTEYVVTANRHAGHVKSMLGITQKTTIALLAIEAGIIFFVTLLIMYGSNRALGNMRKVINNIIDQGWNLTLRLEQRGNDEFSQVAGMFNLFIERLRDTLLQVRTSSTEIATAAENIRQGNDNLADRNAEQSSSLEETASSMEEMTSIVQSHANNAGEVTALAEKMRETAQQGGNIVSEAIVAMGEINDSSSKMAEIIAVVDGISFQTNLLALNAAVEAARAGEQGRGFSVVAAEVRALAQRSAEAAKEVKQLIEESSKRVKAGSDQVNRSGVVFTEIIDGAASVHQLVAQAATATEEQAQGIEQVNNSVNQMDSMTQQNSILVEEIALASQNMQEQTDRLQAMVSSFTLEYGMEKSGSRLAIETSPHDSRGQDVNGPTVKQEHHRLADMELSPEWDTY